MSINTHILEKYVLWFDSRLTGMGQTIGTSGDEHSRLASPSDVPSSCEMSRRPGYILLIVSVSSQTTSTSGDDVSTMVAGDWSLALKQNKYIVKECNTQ